MSPEIVSYHENNEPKNIPTLNEYTVFLIFPHAMGFMGLRWLDWIHDDQNWRDIMAQMNHRMAIANILFPMEDWEDRLFRSKFRLAHRMHDRLKHGRLNPFPGILGRTGSRISLVCLKGNVAVHQHVGMTP